MTTAITPEHLRHYEYDTAPFTPDEVAAIRAYEYGANEYGANELADFLSTAGDLANRTAEEAAAEDAATPDDLNKAVEIDRAYILAHLEWLSMWYRRLDSLHARIGYSGNTADRAAAKYLREECNRWAHTLNLVRREACRWAFGTVGPQIVVDAGTLGFSNFYNVPLDGTIAAESQ